MSKYLLIERPGQDSLLISGEMVSGIKRSSAYEPKKERVTISLKSGKQHDVYGSVKEVAEALGITYTTMQGGR